MTEDKANPTSDSDNAPAAQPTAAEPVQQSAGLVAGPLCMGITGLVIGLLIWLVLEWQFPFFHPTVPKNASSRPLSPEVTAQLAAEASTATLKNSIASGILIGLLGGLGFAAAEGLARRRPLRHVPWVVLAVVLCAGLGAAAAYVAQGFQQAWRFDRSIEPMTRTLATQWIFWSMVAAGLGLSLGISTRRVSQTLGTALQLVFGAVIVGLLYVPLAGYIFPTDDAERIVPMSTGNRALWAIPALAILGLLLGLARQRRKPAAK